jgi:hypothetical protein
MKECLRCGEIYEVKVSFCPLDGEPLTELITQDHFIGKLLADKYRLIEKNR